MSEYTKWNDDGTINLTAGSTVVTGTNTYWKTAGIKPGDLLEINHSGRFVQVASVDGDTTLTLARPYAGTTVTGTEYAIVRNFTAHMPAEIASQTTEILGKMGKYLDADITKLNGRSAYEVAVANGFTGTEAAWLESLKAAQEWSKLDNRSGILTYNSAWAHNSYIRGKNLGTQISAEHLAAIKAGTFTDIYPGDYFTKSGWINIDVLGCDPFLWQWVLNNQWITARHHIAVRMIAWRDWKMNETATTEGGLYNSYMHNTHFPAVLAAAEEIAGGAENIVPLWTRIADAVDETGKPTHFIQSYEKIFIPTTAERFGFVHENSSYPEHKMQLPYYRNMMRVTNIYNNLNWTDMAASDRAFYTYGQATSATLVKSNANESSHGCEFYFLIG